MLQVTERLVFTVTTYVYRAITKFVKNLSYVGSRFTPPELFLPLNK